MPSITYDAGQMDFARIKLLLNPKVRGTDILCYSYLYMLSAHSSSTYVGMNHTDLETQTTDVISICGDHSRLISLNGVVSTITCPCDWSHPLGFSYTLHVLQTRSCFMRLKSNFVNIKSECGKQFCCNNINGYGNNIKAIK